MTNSVRLLSDGGDKGPQSKVALSRYYMMKVHSVVPMKGIVVLLALSAASHFAPAVGMVVWPLLLIYLIAILGMLIDQSPDIDEYGNMEGRTR